MSGEDGRPRDETLGDATGDAQGTLSSAPPDPGDGAPHAPASTDPDEPRAEPASGADAEGEAGRETGQRPGNEPLARSEDAPGEQSDRASDDWLDDPRPAPEPGGEQSAEESLDEALGHLERMLERRDDADSPPGGSRSESGAERRTEQQYEIPLLDEVVLPGADTGRVAGRGAAHDMGGIAGETPREESDELSRLVAERLASEIEIIVNDRIERAIGEALADTQTRVREHLAIVLPEIVDELRQVRRDGGRNPHGS